MSGSAEIGSSQLTRTRPGPHPPPPGLETRTVGTGLRPPEEPIWWGNDPNVAAGFVSGVGSALEGSAAVKQFVWTVPGQLSPLQSPGLVCVLLFASCPCTA